MLEKLSAQDPPASASLIQVLVAKEKEMFNVITNGDKPAAEKLLGPDYITINADGVMQNKDETIKVIGKFKGSMSVLPDKKIRSYGNISIITGRAKAYMHQILVADFLYTETWIYRAGQWQFIGWQGTMTGLPSWYPVISTAVLLGLVFLSTGYISKKIMNKKSRERSQVFGKSSLV